MSCVRIWFWQRIVTPHMVELASELARQGHDVTYVAEVPMTTDRLELGWKAPSLVEVRVEYASTINKISTLVVSAPSDSIHICQGIRANGLVGVAQDALRARRLRQWVIMETVDDAGWLGVFKRFEYWRLFAVWNKHLQGVLAIGHDTTRWVIARGLLRSHVFPFAYFLKDLGLVDCHYHEMRSRFSYIFVGQFIERKRLDLLLEALYRIDNQNFDLTVVGSGPMESGLRIRADKLFPGRVIWSGCLTMKHVLLEMTNADCLVLPSRYDGWGAVVSESMMVGTPVICSDTCGSSTVVRASGKGGVFQSGDCDSLIDHLQCALSGGMVKRIDRIALAKWSSCLGANAGAHYLLDILQHDESELEIQPPWNICT